MAQWPCMIGSPGSIGRARLDRPSRSRAHFLSTIGKYFQFVRTGIGEPQIDPGDFNRARPLKLQSFLHDWQVFHVCKNLDWGAPGWPRQFRLCMANLQSFAHFLFHLCHKRSLLPEWIKAEILAAETSWGARIIFYGWRALLFAGIMSDEKKSSIFSFFEPSCAYAWWALMHRFLSVCLSGCDVTKIQTGPKVTWQKIIYPEPFDLQSANFVWW